MNKVILMGRLTANPECKQTQNGVAMCRFTIAVNRQYQKDKQQESDFITCQAWRNTADFVSRYFSKGKPIIVEGSLRNNNYTDKNGINHYGMNVLVESVEFTINDNSQQQATSYQQQPQQNNQYQQPQQYNNYQQAPQQQYPNQYSQQQPYAPNPSYQQNSQQYQQPSQQVNAPQNQTNANNLNNFEEIINDGDIPF